MTSRNISGFFDPKCAVPTFMIESEGVASKCGRYNGIVTSGVLTLFIVFGTIVIIATTLSPPLKPLQSDYDTNAEYDAAMVKYIQDSKEHKENPPKFPFGALIVGIILITIVWLVVPMLSSHLSKMNWKFKREEHDAMRRRGLSEQDIYMKQQDLYEKRMETDARLDAARIQADAMRDAFSNRPSY